MKGILNTLLDTLSGVGLAVPVLLGLIGGGFLVVLFFICFGLSYASKIDKYRKLLIDGSRKFAASEPISDENVDVVYDELQKHPDGVTSGWSRFLDQRVGAPSDYFPARDILSAPEYTGKRTLGKTLFLVCGAIIWVLVGLIGYYYHSSYADGRDWNSAAAVIMALEFLIIPIGLYIIGFLTLDIIYGKKQKRLALSYASFCEALDSKVAVEEREEEEFVQDNIAEINKRVEELIGADDGKDIIEVVTVPKDREPEMDDFLSAEELLKKYELDYSEPEAEPVEEEAPVAENEPAEPVDPEKAAFVESVLEKEDFVRLAIDNEDLIRRLMEEVANADETAATESPAAVALENMTQEESYEWLERVLQICEMALNDPNVDPQDLNNMGELLSQALAVLTDPTCQAAITDYLGMLADKYYSIVEG